MWPVRSTVVVSDGLAAGMVRGMQVQRLRARHDDRLAAGMVQSMRVQRLRARHDDRLAAGMERGIRIIRRLHWVHRRGGLAAGMMVTRLHPLRPPRMRRRPL